MSDADNCAYECWLKILARMWSKLLNVDERDIDISTTFFDLGGDSLTAMKFVQEIREAHRIDFRLRQLIEAPSLSKLAFALRKHQSMPAVGKGTDGKSVRD